MNSAAKIMPQRIPCKYSEKKKEGGPHTGRLPMVDLQKYSYFLMDLR